MNPSIYLDYNATAPQRPEVLARMQEVLALPANPSSAHGFGRAAKQHLEHARKSIAGAISAWVDEIIFCASATEANAMALRGIAGKRLLVSAIEHSSVLKARGDAALIPVTKDGVVDLAALDALLKNQSPALVSVMLANNETGVVQPVREVAELCRKYDALLHCDAVQGLGKMPVDFGALGADMMTLSAHKCGGPVGAAALVARRNLPVAPLLLGGGQESSRRAGTENVAAITGFAVAAEKSQNMGDLRGWLDAMEKEMIALGATVFGKNSVRLPNTSCVAMPGVSHEVQLMDFDLQGFAVSAGSACSSGRIENSHVLLAMGAGALAGDAIRISGGWNTTQKEIADFTAAWKRLSTRLASKKTG